ncbi:hypothetical protein ACF073_32395 [Streptomyces sp. NPDC015171]|uniref:hypothetical protein n=1 Tax=Streptomyces sp. NPDC015171 TaxID=3364945 RepID=UPI0036F6CB44
MTTLTISVAHVLLKSIIAFLMSGLNVLSWTVSFYPSTQAVCMYRLDDGYGPPSTTSAT